MRQELNSDDEFVRTNEFERTIVVVFNNGAMMSCGVCRTIFHEFHEDSTLRWNYREAKILNVNIAKY